MSRRLPKRRIFVGDVQGCCAELQELLERVAFDPTDDELRPVGDLVNRGPDSLGVLRLMRRLGALPVLGNHDLHLLAVAAGRREPRPGDTLNDVLAADDGPELLEWLEAQPLLRVDPDLYQVHAGLHPGWTDPAAALLSGSLADMGDDVVRFATRVRRCCPAGRFPEEAAADEAQAMAPWFDHYEPTKHGGRRVVFGHWAVRGLVHERHVIGLDTGCVWGGALTAWVPEEERFVQVPARAVHCRPG